MRLRMRSLRWWCCFCFAAIAEPDFVDHTCDRACCILQDLAAVDRTVTPWVILTGHRPMYSSSEGFTLTAEPVPGGGAGRGGHDGTLAWLAEGERDACVCCFLHDCVSERRVVVRAVCCDVLQTTCEGLWSPFCCSTRLTCSWWVNRAQLWLSAWLQKSQCSCGCVDVLVLLYATCCRLATSTRTSARAHSRGTSRWVLLRASLGSS